MFYYTFSVINTMFVPCTLLLYEQKLEQSNCPQLYWAFLVQSIWFLFWWCPLLTIQVLCLRWWFEMKWCLIFQTENVNTSGITSHRTESFNIKPITPGHPIPKISSCLAIFWGGTWKTEFVKTFTDKRGHHQKKNQTDCTRNAQ